MSDLIDPEMDAVPEPDKPLSPRHRKLAELLAAGWKNKDIKKELGYCDSRISILKKNPAILAYVNKLMDRAYEEGPAQRLRGLNEGALGIIETALMDRTNRTSMKDKIDVAKWIVEKTDGKAVQKHEVSGGILLGVLDKIDSMKKSGKDLNSLPLPRDVTPKDKIDEESMTDAEKEEYEMLKKWQEGF